MRIAIIGGGVAGSTAAAMLGRAGVAAILVDPHRDYPPDFRVEKLSGDEQIARFRKTGIADAVLRKASDEFDDGHLMDAMALARKAASSGGGAKAHALLGYIYMSQGQLPGAERGAGP